MFNKARKWIAILLALSCLLTLAACGDKPQDQQQTAETQSAQEDLQQPQEQTDEAGPSIDNVKDSIPAESNKTPVKQVTKNEARKISVKARSINTSMPNGVVHSNQNLSVKVGDKFRFTTDLATDVNGDNGLTFYYTTDGKTIYPFKNYAAQENKWWVTGRGCLVYPSVIPEDNYGVAGSSSDEYVVTGYQVPATGTINLYTWTAIQGPHGDHGYRIKIAKGRVTNVIGSYDCIGDTQTVTADTYTMKVEKGENIYLIYEPVVKKDGEWYGFITDVTYVAMGDDEYNNGVTHRDPIVPDIEVKGGQTFKFCDLATDVNGDNGLTFMYTSDGENLYNFVNRVPEEDKWWEGGRGCLVYPHVIPADNYGVAGVSETDYPVMRYQCAASGLVNVYTWTAIQGPHGNHGYHVKVAYDDPTNIIGTYDCIGDTQTVASQNYLFQVEKGKMIYLLYEPTVKVDGEWFGYITSVTYTGMRKVPIEPDIGINDGDEIHFTDFATPIDGEYLNGDYGLTYFYVNSKGDNEFNQWDYGQNRWYHGERGTILCPCANKDDFYGYGGTSKSDSIKMMYTIPESGKIALYHWTALHSGDPYHITVALGNEKGIVAEYDALGGHDAITEMSKTLSVKRGDWLFITYECIDPVDEAWFGFKINMKYLKVGEPDVDYRVSPIVPDISDEIQEGSVIRFVDQVEPINGEYINGDHGLTYYYKDEKGLHPFTDIDMTYDRWAYGSGGALIDPDANVTDNYCLGGTSKKESVVAAYQMPAKGKIALFNWVALHSADPYHVTVSLNELDNVIKSYDCLGGTDAITTKTITTKVEKGDILYITYDCINPKDGAWFGFITSVTYNYVGDGPRDPIVPELTVKLNDLFRFVDFSKPINGEYVNGDHGLTFYYTEDGSNLIPFEDYDKTEKKFYHESDGVLAYPCSVEADNYGLVGTSAKEYVVLEYQVPQSGTLDVFTWFVSQSGDIYNFTLAQNTLDNALYSTGFGDAVKYMNTRTTVTKGDRLYFIYKPMSPENQAWLGYQNSVKYVALAPDAPVEQDTTFSFASIAKAADGVNGQGGLTAYWTSNGKTLTAFSDYDNVLDRWYYDENGCFSDMDNNVAENYGVCGTSKKEYVVLGYQIPATGKIELKNWLLSLTGNKYSLKIYTGGKIAASNLLKTVNFQDTPVIDTATLDVTKGDTLLFVFKSSSPKVSESFGYKTELTYKSVVVPQ